MSNSSFASRRTSGIVYIEIAVNYAIKHKWNFIFSELPIGLCFIRIILYYIGCVLSYCRLTITTSSAAARAHAVTYCRWNGGQFCHIIMTDLVLNAACGAIIRSITYKMYVAIINHNSTGVTSDVSLSEKIELEFESNLNKADYRFQK